MQSTEPTSQDRQTLALLLNAVCMLATLFVAGCAVPPTPASLQPEFALQDIQGLFGGWDIYVYPDNSCLIRMVTQEEGLKSGLREHRYMARLPSGSVESFRMRAKECDLTSYRQIRKLGVQDEGHPEIFWRIDSRRVFSAMKWAGDKDSHFDSIRSSLDQFVNTAKLTRTLYNGPYDWEWKHPNLETAL